jgi:hypothetical protein
MDSEWRWGRISSRAEPQLSVRSAKARDLARREHRSIADIVERALEAYEIREAGREPASAFFAPIRGSRAWSRVGLLAPPFCRPDLPLHGRRRARLRRRHEYSAPTGPTHDRPRRNDRRHCAHQRRALGDPELPGLRNDRSRTDLSVGFLRQQGVGRLPPCRVICLCRSPRMGQAGRTARNRGCRLEPLRDICRRGPANE